MRQAPVMSRHTLRQPLRHTLQRSAHLLAAAVLGGACLAVPAWAQAQPNAAPAAKAGQAYADYALAASDAIRIQVFQNPDLTLETRVSESGTLTYPLIGLVEVGGLSIAAAEKKIADALRNGGFLRDPQVSITLLQVRGNQVSVLGLVGRPGRYPLESANTRLSDVLAAAGGATPAGDDVAIVSGVRNGQPFQQRVDVAQLFLAHEWQNDLVVQGGDVVYVHRAPVFYIYGSAQRPGAYRIERGMTVMQALALGGGPTLRGSETRLRLHRKLADGTVQQATPEWNDPIQPNDVLFVRESLF